jgi:hypothetical protein
VVQAECQEVGTELGSLRSARGLANTSSLPASPSSGAELIGDRVNAATANGSAGGQSALTATLSHFPKLEIELELHGSRRNTDLTEGQLDTLWT